MLYLFLPYYRLFFYRTLTGFTFRLQNTIHFYWDEVTREASATRDARSPLRLENNEEGCRRRDKFKQFYVRLKIFTSLIEKRKEDGGSNERGNQVRYEVEKDTSTKV